MVLDPQAKALLAKLAEQGLPSTDEMSLPHAREAVLMFEELEGEPQPVAQVRDLTVPGPAGELPVRLYTPHLAPQGTRPTPLVVFFHGGGWVRGSVEIADRPCRALANTSGCTVASVEYRLAPESKFPAAAEDCYAVVSWLAKHAGELDSDSERVAIAGDSAGGNLAAAVALMARDRGGPSLSYQVLIYPATDARGDYPSRRENAEGYFLTTRAMEWYWRHYLSDDASRDNPYVSPLRAVNHSDLPPALIVTCEYDPLRDEGEAYGEKLREAGVPVKVSRYEGMVHGILWMGGMIDRTEDLIEEMGRELGAALGTR
jgi:acetyl esterase/lipase